MKGISIAIINSYDGATSDSSVFFTATEKSEQILKATVTDYKPFEEKINILLQHNCFKHSIERRNHRTESSSEQRGTF